MSQASFVARAAVLGLGFAAVACASATVRRGDGPKHDYPAGVIQTRWRVALNDKARFSPRPEECATGVVIDRPADGLGRRFVIGSRAGRVLATAANDGRILWSIEVDGAVDSEATFDAKRDQIYVGTDAGTLYALDPATGATKWTYKGKGAVERAPAFDATSLFLATAADRIVSLDPATGKLRWQYDREPPEGFGIRGHAAPLLANDLVLIGFSDGFLVALRAGASTADVVWARSLAGASEQYVDVDTTPVVVGDTVFAASYSGGLYALAAASGEVKWQATIEGVSTLRHFEGRLYFAAPREGLTAMTLDGHVLWRQGLAEAGDLTSPQAIGPYLLFTGGRAGLFVIDRKSGSLEEVFNPGRGMCGAPAIDRGGDAYVLSNSGSLYALQIATP